MYHYRAFGLNIASDIFIREFLKECSIQSDVLIRQGEDSTAEFILPVESIGTFYISNGDTILYQPQKGVHPDAFRLFLLGSAMGALLQQRGLIVLHGNAISFDNKTCSIFVGHSGAGKSTMAAYAWQQGAQILADDVCAIFFDEAGKPCVYPSYPQLKLWQNTANLLKIDTSTLPRIRPQDEKYALKIEGQFCSMPLPLKAVFEIDPDPALIEPKEIKGVAKMKVLFEHTYRAHFLKPMGQEKAYTQQLMRLAACVVILRQGRLNIGS